MPSVIRRGSTGPDVIRLQELLNKHLRPSPQLKVDGIFGPRTEAATSRYQSMAGLSIDGVVGSLSWSSLEGGVTTGRIEQPLRPTSGHNAPWLTVVPETNQNCWNKLSSSDQLVSLG